MRWGIAYFGERAYFGKGKKELQIIEKLKRIKAQIDRKQKTIEAQIDISPNGQKPKLTEAQIDRSPNFAAKCVMT